jgi:hypothetical protein
MSKKHLLQPGFRFGWEPLQTRITVKKGGYLSMREWQEEAFLELRNERFWIINAPMASGKTFEIGCLVIDKLIRNPTMRAIIAVPQTIIGLGFKEMKIEMPDGERYDWAPRHDLCNGTDEKNAQYLLDWLVGPSAREDIQDRMLVCSHSTLVRSFKQNPDLFRDACVVIDEAHHVQYAEHENLGLELINGIGGLVKWAVTQTGLKLHVGLTTATFFRGDKNDIVPERYQKKFTRYNLPYDRFLKSMKHLRSMSYDFYLCNHNFESAVAKVFDGSVEKTIVYIPPVRSHFTVGDKHDDVTAVYKAIAKSETPEIREREDGITLVRRGQVWVKVVNLVDEDNRDAKKNAVYAAHDAKDGSKLDVVIALGMFKEGANWKWANREIILGTRHSLTETIQTIGRLFRDAEGKRHVSIFHMLPFSLDQIDRENTRISLNNFMKAIFASMLLENIMYPVGLDPKFQEEEEKPEDNTEKKRPVDHFMEACGDAAVANGVLDDFKDTIIDAVREDDTLNHDHGKFQAVFKDKLLKTMEGHGVSVGNATKKADKIVEQVYKMLKRRSVDVGGYDVKSINYEIIKNVSVLDFILKYGSDACGVRTFEEFRKAIKAIAYLPFEKARSFVRMLGLKSLSYWIRWAKSQKKPEGIPSYPQGIYYDKGWTSYGDWLGTGTVATRNRKYRPFAEAREFVRALGLKTVNDWVAWVKTNKKPDDIPMNPIKVYDEWVSWNDWLNNNWMSRKHRSFVEARKFVRKLGLENSVAWAKWAASNERPMDIPIVPHSVYRNDGWVSIRDWIGGGGKVCKSDRLPFVKARKFVRGLGLKTSDEWFAYCKTGNKPNNIPSFPRNPYKDEGWISMGDWIGTGNIATRDREYRPFAEAREFVRKLGLKNSDEWKAYTKSGNMPTDIPSCPVNVWKNNGWISMGDWLGNRFVATQNRTYRSFVRARKFVRGLGIKTHEEWVIFVKTGKLPKDIPSTPDSAGVYTNDWISWGNWLGTGRIA